MRFELVFATGIFMLWVLGVFGRGKREKDTAQTPSRVVRRVPVKQQPQKSIECTRVSPLGAPTLPEKIGFEDELEAFARNNGASNQLRELTTITNLRADSPCLKDAAWLFPRLIQLCHGQATRAFTIYYSALAAGLDLGRVPAVERDHLFMAFVTSMIRMGLLDDCMRLLRDLKRRRVKLSPSLHNSAIKLCTAKHCFRECLELHDLLMELVEFTTPVDKSIWSCLLFCGVESQAFQRCTHFFDMLKRCGSPSQKDYLNMIRMGSANGAWKLMFVLIQEMQEQGLEIDSIIYNTVLAACVSSDQVGQAQKLLDEMDKVGGVVDVITYNTIMKGYAKHGHIDECFRLFEQMPQRDLEPSQVTYGILLDACVNTHQIHRTSMLFDKMIDTGIPMNTVIYTTLIKGFAREGNVDQAMRVYRQMIQEKTIVPDLITFAILLKANCDKGRLEAALELLEAMQTLGLTPDEVIFNNLLSGCAKNDNCDLAKQLYKNMIQSGVKPSSATFSILIRLYSQSRLLEEAIDMLKTQPEAHGVDIEPRLFVQLIQCCIRSRQGRRVTEVYEMMVDHFTPTTAMHSSMLTTCVKLNMFDTAAELLEQASQRGALVDARDAVSVLEGARRKRKTACADSVAASMEALGLTVPQPGTCTHVVAASHAAASAAGEPDMT